MELVIRDGDKFLEGYYYNDRRRKDGTSGSGGAIRLKYTSDDLRHRLNYDRSQRNNWALPRKPSDLLGMRVAALSRRRNKS